MLFLLSPAKSLDYDTPVPESLPHTRPQFVPQSTALIEVLREKSVQDIASLMDLSDPLAALNVARYQAWKPQFTAHNSRQAVLAFDGERLVGASTAVPLVEFGSPKPSVSPARWRSTSSRLFSGLSRWTTSSE